MRKYQVLSAAAVVGLALSSAGAAHAATLGAPVSVNSNGIWNNLEAGPFGLADVNGEGTNQISWGIPANAAGVQSGYAFDGTTSDFDLPTLGETVQFKLGTFTHNNLVIFQNGGDFQGATLNLDLSDLTGNNTPVTVAFDHFETPNFANPCAAGGTQPCPDQVSLPDNGPIQFSIGEWNYEFEVAGFTLSDAAGAPVVDNFLTLENQANSAWLVGQVTKVPEPTTVLGAGLVLGFGVLLRQRRRQQA